jgi:hypothetical protein
MVQTMNATQRRFAVERARSIINGKKIEMRVDGFGYPNGPHFKNWMIEHKLLNYIREFPNSVSPEKLVKYFLGTLKQPHRGFGIDTLDELKTQPEFVSVVREAAQEAEDLQKKYQYLDDTFKNFESQIMLGDAAEALKMLSDLEKL